MRATPATVTLLFITSTAVSNARASGKGDGEQLQAPNASPAPLVLATDPRGDGGRVEDEPPRREPPGDAVYVEDGAGPRLSFGRALHLEIPDGWYGRFETEYFEQEARGHRRRQGAVGGGRLGVEGWGSSRDWGAGLPVTAYGGYRQPLQRARKLDLFGALGVGVDVICFDRIADKSSVGVLAPRGELVLGFDFGGVRVLADGGVQYRWHLGAGDLLQLRMGIGLGLHAELWDG